MTTQEFINALRQCITNSGAACFREPSIESLTRRIESINDLCCSALDDIKAGYSQATDRHVGDDEPNAKSAHTGTPLDPHRLGSPAPHDC